MVERFELYLTDPHPCIILVVPVAHAHVFVAGPYRDNKAVLTVDTGFVLLLCGGGGHDRQHEQQQRLF